MSATKSNISSPSDDVLRQLYVDQKLGCPDIGRMYERDPKTVLHWLRQAGIQTRPRGSDKRQHFKQGERSAFAGRKHSAESLTKIRVSTIADGRVPYLRNGEHWLKGAKPEDNPNWKGGVTPERQEFYRSPEWKLACRIVWARANACCERCGLDYRTVDRKTTPKFHVHHVLSFQIRETRAQPAFLVLLCRTCHLFVHSKANTTMEFLPQEIGTSLLPDTDSPVIDLADMHRFMGQLDNIFASAKRQAAEREMSMPGLFDTIEMPEAA